VYQYYTVCVLMNTAEISTDSTRKYIKCQLWYTAYKPEINKVQSTYHRLSWLVWN